MSRLPMPRVRGVVAALARDDVDTDLIVPQRFLNVVRRSGLAASLFADLRGDGEARSGFVLDQVPWNHAAILVTGRNFGCGSAREHAVWALVDFGIRCVAAPSFADIFSRNAVLNGLLPLRLAAQPLAWLEDLACRGGIAEVDLERSTLSAAGGGGFAIEIDPIDRRALLDGRDEVDCTLERIDRIREHEARRPDDPFERAGSRDPCDA